MNTTTPEMDALNKGISLFNDGKYLAVHEAWEDLWFNENDADERKFLHGLLMAAGSFHHYTRRECRGAHELLTKSIPLIRAGLNSHPNLRLFDFIQALGGLRDEFKDARFPSTGSLCRKSRGCMSTADP